MKPARVVLPKHWKYMCRCAGLRPATYHRSRHRWFYLKGHGRRWYVDTLGMFRSSGPYSNFDRWTDSASGHAIPVPRTQKEMELFVLFRDHDTRPTTAL